MTEIHDSPDPVDDLIPGLEFEVQSEAQRDSLLILPSVFQRQRARLRGSGFVRNAGVLVSAAVMTQAVSLLTAPILTRLYSPSDYGLVGLFMTVANLIGVIVALQVPRTILLPADNRNAAALFRLSLWLPLCATTVLMVAAIGFRSEIARAFGMPELSVWVPLLPLAVLSGAAMTSLTVWANRRSWYKSLSASRVVSSILAALTSLVVGFTIVGAAGLVAGFFVGQVSSVAILAWPTIRHDRVLLSSPTAWRIRGVAKRYRATALASVPSLFFYTLLQQVPVYLLSSYGLQAVGHYNMTQRLLGIPTALVGASVAEVFQQRASESYRTTGSFRHEYVRVLRAMVLLGVVPFVVIVLAGPILFRFVLGDQWEAAGQLAQVLALSQWFGLVAGPLYCAFFVTERNREMMLAQGGFLAAACAAMAGAHYFELDYQIAVGLYSIVFSLMCAYFIARGFLLSK